ncbi:hypothetical protein GGR56DRAFT_83436 [Xylariaceae sp. FL0804]|nr:hypothetical protein GGR56DRAFT_83436 [Xylariaceae sp. FL0804]
MTSQAPLAAAEARFEEEIIPSRTRRPSEPFGLVADPGSPTNANGLERRLGSWNVARRTLGISLLLCTVFLWTASNFLASYIFSDRTYNKPFFLVYINTSVFAISLIPISIRHIVRNGGFANAKSIALRAWRDGGGSGGGGAASHGAGRRLRKARVEAGDDPTAGDRLLADDDRDDHDFDGYDDEYDGSDLEALGMIQAKPTTPAAAMASDGGGDDQEKMSLRETARLSLEFCMIWFAGNYFASACLEYTSVGSVTILTSTSSVWTLVLCAARGIEPFSARKLAGVLASLAGVALVSMVDLSGAGGGEDGGSNNGNGNGSTFPQKSFAEVAVGDAMALFSAVVYGVYVVVMKARVGSEDRVNMPVFFGLVGVFNILLLWPLFPILHYTGIEPFEWPPTGKIWSIIVLNSISSFLSDLSWAYAMLLTTPLVVTVGLSLTIPLSLVGEMIQYAQYSSFIYWVGAAVVLLSFVFINRESHEEEKKQQQQQQQQAAAADDDGPGLRATELL